MRCRKQARQKRLWQYLPGHWSLKYWGPQSHRRRCGAWPQRWRRATSWRILRRPDAGLLQLNELLLCSRVAQVAVALQSRPSIARTLCSMGIRRFGALGTTLSLVAGATGAAMACAVTGCVQWRQGRCSHQSQRSQHKWEKLKILPVLPVVKVAGARSPWLASKGSSLARVLQTRWTSCYTGFEPCFATGVKHCAKAYPRSSHMSASALGNSWVMLNAPWLHC
mmetsp:Transcript_3815/g.8866  ORF Transcript_3815/g.8866 Transcript_3815/m.8866 type:complete len:223 (-) Transcript_3815:174-842(-)